MTWDEFTAWYGYHVTHYDGIDAWMSNAVKRQHDQPKLTGADEKMRAWFGVLRETDYKLARKATDILAAEPDENQPKGYDAHPRRIASIARGLADRAARQAPAPRRTVGGQETFRCLACRDSGWVLVWGDKSVRHIENLLNEGVPEDWHPDQAFDTGMITRWKGRELRERAGMYSALAACSCEAGAHHHERGTPIYSENDFCRIWGTSPYADSGGWGTEQEIAYLVRWVAKRLGSRHAHQLAAF